MPIKSENKIVLLVGTLQALFKGFSVFYMLLLPILYALGTISAEALGYVGAFSILGIMIGAFLVSYKLHIVSKLNVFWTALAILFVANLALFWAHNTVLLLAAFMLVGIGSGLGLTTSSALSGQLTKKGQRFNALAKMAMMMDTLRMLLPLIVGGIFAFLGFTGLVYFAMGAIVCVCAYVVFLSRMLNLTDEATEESPDATDVPMRQNKSYWYAVWVEFMDAVASSQLFVFLPTLLLFKNFSIENAVMMQSVVFLGYLSGRLVIARLAVSLGGYRAVAISEMGMVFAIALLLAIPASALLYALCFVLGIFTRGTSQVIKALVLDSLEPTKIRRGLAIYTTVGEAGSAVAQFGFGFLLAWFGVAAPFWAAVVFAVLAAVFCFARKPHE